MKKLILSSVLVGLAACSAHAPVSNANVDLVLEQSHRLIKTGESVTFTAHATGVAGRDEKIKWQAKGGDFSQLNDTERYARVEYDIPGTYTVTAMLYVDDRLVDQEQAVIKVEPLT